MKIGVISNCQVYGYINCLSLLGKNCEVMGCAVPHLEKKKKDFSDCDFIYVAPEFKEDAIKTLGKKLGQRMRPLPTVIFDRFHPDMTYARNAEGSLQGVLDAYHSLICFTAYKAGRNVEETLKLYNNAVYNYLGYLSGWEEAARNFLDTFERADLDIRHHFTNWTRRGAFMHTFNHPHIECLFDIARAALERDEVPHHDLHRCMVHDNLSQGVQYPVYPEVAERYGFSGDYKFKLFHQYKVVDLDEFVEQSFKRYDEMDMENAAVTKMRANEYALLMEALQNGRF